MDMFDIVCVCTYMCVYAWVCVKLKSDPFCCILLTIYTFLACVCVCWMSGSFFPVQLYMFTFFIIATTTCYIWFFSCLCVYVCDHEQNHCVCYAYQYGNTWNLHASELLSVFSLLQWVFVRWAFCLTSLGWVSFCQFPIWNSPLIGSHFLTVRIPSGAQEKFVSVFPSQNDVLTRCQCAPPPCVHIRTYAR